MSDNPALFLLADCATCGRRFTCNPYRVPSLRMRAGRLDPSGVREPICRDCAERINQQLAAAGVPQRFDVTDEAYSPTDDLG